MEDLERKLEDSLHLFRGPFAAEHELHAVHAQLAKGAREAKRFTLIERTRVNDAEPNSAR